MCRELDRPRTDLKLEFMHLDLSSFVSTKRFADEFIAKNLDLHILINNAGIAFIPFGEAYTISFLTLCMPSTTHTPDVVLCMYMCI